MWDACQVLGISFGGLPGRILEFRGLGLREEFGKLGSCRGVVEMS